MSGFLREMSYRSRIYMAVRYLLIAGLLAAIILLCVGKQESRVPFAEVSEKVAASLASEEMEEGAVRFLKKNFFLNAEDFAGVLIYIPKTNMSAKEALLLKLNDAGQAQEAESRIRERIASQMQIFSGYAPEQVALLEKAVVDVQGNYIFYAVGEDAAKADEVFRGSL